MYFLLTCNILLGKKVKNEVRLASLSTIYMIENSDSTEEAIKTCGFLKFVSFYYLFEILYIGNRNALL